MLVEDAPDSKGVYALWLNDEIIYLGHAAGAGITIRSSLKQLLAERASASTRPTHYSWELCTNPAERERQLIELLGEVPGTRAIAKKDGAGQKESKGG
jgi:hypothetical protein